MDGLLVVYLYFPWPKTYDSTLNSLQSDYWIIFYNRNTIKIATMAAIFENGDHLEFFGFVNGFFFFNQVALEEPYCKFWCLYHKVNDSSDLNTYLPHFSEAIL